MYADQCPTHNHLKYIFLSFLFRTFTIVHLDSFYTYTFPSFPIFSFLTTFIFLRVGTHTHPRNTASPMSKTGRRLGRETNHPTRPAGTLVRETHHPIISRKIWPGKHISSNRTTSGTDQGNTQTQSRDSSTPVPTSSIKTTHKHWKTGTSAT